jgi:protein required for attachment to host cells
MCCPWRKGIYVLASGSVEGRIVAEVAKDLTGHPVPEIEKLLFG